MSRSDNIKKAKEMIAARRAESKGNFENNILIANANIPGFADIDRELSLTGSKIRRQLWEKAIVLCL